ncbi:MAG: lipoyl(octanoyl) transferase LipB [Cyanobacteria bacterium]|nr:lipoyl(octanoyl) transferase LipB [Cyanobacteriota bacterium]
MTAFAKRSLQVIDFGLSDYASIYAQQKIWIDTLTDNFDDPDQPDILLMGEHYPVITRGRASKEENLLEVLPETAVVSIERGGDVTYHAPGQLVVYPIYRLYPHERDLHQYLRRLETVVIAVLAAYDIEGIRQPGYTGVWVESSSGGKEITSKKIGYKKIASIGVAVKHWVTYHGLSLNINNPLTEFSQINPCGLNASQMTRLGDLVTDQVDMTCVKAQLVEAFCGEFAAES